VLKELNETGSCWNKSLTMCLFSRDKMIAIVAENQELRWIKRRLN